MELKKVDKNMEMMKEDHGTVCLITEYGVADRLMKRAETRAKNVDRLIRSIDSWDI